ncbi:YodC family protein [Pasteurella multocida]|nr:DUF2158 domain-containing protein [Pasteurella multocida]MEB3472280.1 DUF2158 domain-containing protein [Pasteurella multocida]NNI15167.1 DUF2158 domain-containing protein [Pasteurella multocida]NNI58752.1 DUF2158 domain-containing protein [Pasteurella multocida]NNI82627.1 DUF2158 domain-containing protein [Pasteurella multocida]HDR1514776.1 DUF2158 domain-containing protein [Pasteurella multocida]
MYTRENQFHVGDIVKLKSGGPDMTIKTVARNGLSDTFTGFYDCQWFAGKKLESGRFPEESLELIVNE